MDRTRTVFEETHGTMISSVKITGKHQSSSQRKTRRPIDQPLPGDIPAQSHGLWPPWGNLEINSKINTRCHRRHPRKHSGVLRVGRAPQSYGNSSSAVLLLADAPYTAEFIHAFTGVRLPVYRPMSSRCFTNRTTRV